MVDSAPELATETKPEATQEAKPPVEPSPDFIRTSYHQHTPEELVARAIAPVKREFLRPPPSRTAQNDSVEEADGKQSHAGLVKEKKSKRQLKRERLQERKSASNLCPEIAKTGDVSACPYSEKCRFSHDIAAFKAQKPDDLDGECPFTIGETPCPYGLSCRFFGSHKDGNAASSVNGLKNISELNVLSKDVQKVLWKNKMKFKKADAVLKLLGLMGPKSKAKLENQDGEKITAYNPQVSDKNNGLKVDADPIDKLEHSASILVEDDIDEACPADDLRPLKKAKSSDDEKNCCHEPEDGGSAVDEKGSCNNLDHDEAISEKDFGRDGAKSEPVSRLDDVVTEPERSLKIHPREKKLIDFRGKLYLAPLTTVGNLPFRRVCKSLGADVTCGEMAMCTNLLQGQASEWALLRRHQSEDLFGVQICGAYPDTIARTVELIERECAVDFIDINMGCPIDIVVNKGAGSSLLTKPTRMKNIVEVASATVEKPITIKVRTGYFEGKNRIDSLINDMGNWGASAVTVHGRSRQQRYSKLADWDYIYQCARKAPDMLQVLGNGDVFSYLDRNKHVFDCPKLSTCMIARGALIKPWIFTEIKDQRHWDISSEERFNILKDYTRFGLEHWGSDTKGVEKTRHFLLEWLSYTCRYIPVGLLDVIPQRLNWRPPSYYGRNDLETLMASDSAADWIRISEMLLGKVPDGFTFAPKHKSNAYDRAENG